MKLDLRVLLVGLLSVAGAAVAEEPLQAAPEIRELASRAYPRRLSVDDSQTRRCVVEVTLGAKGKPAQVAPLDYPEALYRYARRHARKDRWVKDAPEGARFAHELVYVPPADSADIPQALTWRFQEPGKSCLLHLEIEHDGAVALGRPAEQADCVPELPGSLPVPDLPRLRRDAPIECPVRFVVGTEGEVRQVQVYACPNPTWKTARAAVEAVSWPVAEHPRAFSVRLQWDGPPWFDPAP